MKPVFIAPSVMSLVLGTSLSSLAQQPPPKQADPKIMLAAVFRDYSMLAGRISSGASTARGKADIEPLAYITESGAWSDIPCHGNADCRKFEREYLRKSHEYKVVSAEGEGAVVRSAPTMLSECFGFSGKASYSGQSIAGSAIAASNPDFFLHSDPPKLFTASAAQPILRLLAPLIPKRLDSAKHLRLYSVRLEGRDLLVAQRTYWDMPKKEQMGSLKLMFGVGAVEKNRIRVLFWKREADDDQEERILGTIRLKSGLEFLITSVNDPEGQWFHVDGVRDGKLTLIYSGGGASC